MHLHVLESLGLLELLNKDQRQQVAGLVTTVVYQPGDSRGVVELNQPATHFHVIKSGRADLVLVDRLDPIGW